jgi:hypothetical protein|tara:strand:+ start:5253 stop:6137 length:885 start_codon:yes stop_codon:yes gene_type:complete
MGYPYGDSGFYTRVDLSRQVYQRCETEATFSGSTNLGDNLRVNYLSADTYNFTVSATTGTTVVVGLNTQPRLNGSSLQISPFTLHSGSGTDLEIDLTNGDVFRTSSSRRYKENIRNMELDQLKKFLQLSSKKFTWKGNQREDIGLIAEELHYLGLEDWVIYNGPPSLDTVESVKYKQLSVGLLELVKDLYRIVDRKPLEESIGNFDSVKVVSEDYTTENVKCIITKKNDVTVTLDPTQSNRFYIKSMTSTTIKPHVGLIDEEWEEMYLDTQSSVELLWSGESWYILSSDGLKNS